MASAIQKLFAKRKAKQAAKRNTSGAGADGTTQHDPQQQADVTRSSKHHASFQAGAAGGHDRGDLPRSISTLAVPSNSVPFPQSTDTASHQPLRSSLDASTLFSSTTGWLGRAAKARFNSTASAPMLDTAPASNRQDSLRAAYLQATDTTEFGQHDVAVALDPSDSDKNDGAEDSDDPTESPIYQSICAIESTRQALRETSIVIVPASGFMTAGVPDRDTLLADAHWLALHMFGPSRLFKDQYSSVQIRAPPIPDSKWRNVSATLTVDSDRGTIVVGRGSLRPAVTLSIATDTNVYKSLPPEPTAEPPVELSFHVVSRQSKHRMPVSKKLRLISVHGSPFADDAQTDDTTASSHLDATKAAMPPPPNISSAPHDAAVSLPTQRYFFQDLFFLVCPGGSLQPALRIAFEVLSDGCRNFDKTYLFVPQYEEQNRQKLRDGVLLPAQRRLSEQLFDQGKHRLLSREGLGVVSSVLENVMMGYLHQRVFPALAEIPHLHAANGKMAEVISAYRNVSLKDFGVQNKELVAAPHTLDQAVARLSSLRAPHLGRQQDAALVATVLDNPLALTDQLHKLASGQRSECDENAGSSDAEVLKSLSLDHRLPSGPATRSHGIQTPLDVIQILGDTIELCQVAHRSTALQADPTRLTRRRYSTFSLSSLEAPGLGSPTSSSHSHLDDGAANLEPLSTDELFPILSYVAARSSVSHMPCLLAYSQAYGQVMQDRRKDAVRADGRDWALVTFQAVCEWLMTDPLNLICEGATKEHSHLDSRQSKAEDPSPASSSPAAHHATPKRDRRRSLPATALLSSRPALSSGSSYRSDRSVGSHGNVLTHQTRSVSRGSSINRGSPDLVVGAGSASTRSDAGIGESYLSFGALSKEEMPRDGALLSAPASASMSRQSSHASAYTARSLSSRSSMSGSAGTNDLTIRRQIHVHSRVSGSGSVHPDAVGSRTSLESRAGSDRGRLLQSPTIRVMGTETTGAGSSNSDQGEFRPVTRTKMTRTESEGPSRRTDISSSTSQRPQLQVSKPSSTRMARRQSVGGLELLSGTTIEEGTSTSAVPPSQASWIPVWLSGTANEGSLVSRSPSEQSSKQFATLSSTQLASSPSSSCMGRSPSGSGFATTISESSSGSAIAMEAKSRTGNVGTGVGLGLALAVRGAENVDISEECTTPTLTTARGGPGASDDTAFTPRLPAYSRTRLLSGGSKSTLHSSVARPVLSSDVGRAVDNARTMADVDRMW